MPKAAIRLARCTEDEKKKPTYTIPYKNTPPTTTPAASTKNYNMNIQRKKIQSKLCHIFGIFIHVWYIPIANEVAIFTNKRFISIQANAKRLDKHT